MLQHVTVGRVHIDDDHVRTQPGDLHRQVHIGGQMRHDLVASRAQAFADAVRPVRVVVNKQHPQHGREPCFDDAAGMRPAAQNPGGVCGARAAPLPQRSWLDG